METGNFDSMNHNEILNDNLGQGIYSDSKYAYIYDGESYVMF